MIKPTYTFDEACIYLNTSGTTLNELVLAAQVKAGKIGQSYVFLHKHLELFLETEIERQTLERLECIGRGEKPRIKTARGRTVKPNLDLLNSQSN